METRRLYYDDPYKVDFDATLLECVPRGERWEVVLDQSAFYPEGGGQPADRGRIDGIDVTNVSVVDGVIRHETAGPVAGPLVHGTIDWGRRFEFMQQHTGQHIVSASFERAAGLHTLSVHLGEGYTSVEVDAASLADGLLERVEDDANEIVRLGRPVVVRFVSADEAQSLPLRKAPPALERLRIVEIEGIDVSACGGTHCSTTGEVGLIKAIGAETIRGHVRVSWLIGARAYRDYRAKSTLVAELARTLTCATEELPARFALLDEERRRALADAAKLEVRLAEQLAAALARSAQPIDGASAPAPAPDPHAPGQSERVRRVAFVSRRFDAERESLVRAVAERLAALPEVVSCLVNDTGELLRLFVGAGSETGVDAPALARSAAAAVDAKGGGKGALWQGVGRRREAAGEFIDAVRGELLRLIGGR